MEVGVGVRVHSAFSLPMGMVAIVMRIRSKTSVTLTIKRDTGESVVGLTNLNDITSIPGIANLAVACS